MKLIPILLVGTAICSIRCTEIAKSQQKERWVLISAPQLLPKDCKKSEPCTGTIYVRAPFADWEQLAENDSFADCAAAIWAPKPDANKELHAKGKLSSAEKMLGFRCVQVGDKRLTTPPPYDWKSESILDE